MFFSKSKTLSIDRPMVFLSGCPRSGTSLLTKIIDSHSQVGVLMEAIFQNRRRHHYKAPFWHNSEKLKQHIAPIFNKINEPIVGNKVCHPDVWSLEDILLFCNLFNSFKIVWIVRDPFDNLYSRYLREPADHYSEEAKKYLCLDYTSQFSTWSSSWRQSLESYTNLKGHLQDDIALVYYDDLIKNPADTILTLCKQLNIEFEESMLNQHEYAHYDAKGNKKFNLKYVDSKVGTVADKKVPSDIETLINQSLLPCDYWIKKWKSRTL